jgi:hypothetical protein
MRLEAEKPESEYNGKIVDKNGEFFPYSIKTHTFQHDHPIASRIKELLQFEIEHHFAMLCAPIFRDAIIFYDRNNHIVSSLNICLSCFYLEPENLSIKADYKTYGYLKKLFLELGHNVEDPNYNIIDEVEVMKQKIKKPKR